MCFVLSFDSALEAAVLAVPASTAQRVGDASVQLARRLIDADRQAEELRAQVRNVH